jgi:NitT/TauT family transport system ATP-binding protein
MTENFPAISFDQVSLSFPSGEGKNIHALRDVSFGIARHEFVSVIGPSGCGKSTSIKLIAGLLPSTAGLVEVNGAAVRGPRDDIGIVFQRPTLLPWFDVLDNVVFPLRHKFGQVSAAERQRAAALLELVGLEEFGRKRITELSGGMQQRAAIARALLLDPNILLMDEPFSALDALTRDDMSFELMRIWSERPKTVVFITHSIQESLLLSDRIIILTPRPAQVARIIDVPFDRPRSADTLRDPRFHDYSEHIRSFLRVRHAAR